MTGREALLVAILESPEDEDLRMMLADLVEEEEGLLFSDFLRGPGVIKIGGNDGLGVFFQGSRPANLPTCYLFSNKNMPHIIRLGQLPSRFWPKCCCGRLADVLSNGVWVAYGCSRRFEKKS